MNRLPAFACCISAFAISAPACAGEVPLYEAAPEWIDTAELTQGELTGDPAEILLDFQHRLEGGTVTAYRDRAVRIDNNEALDSEGTLTLTWAPDKGDLRIHRLEIRRGDEIIDLIEDGVTFEVLRRERGLEQRLLDGRLTATVAVPGLQQGDVLRLAHSTTLADQALGDEMQETQYLPAKPYRVGRGRTIFSWPTGSDVVWQAGPDVDLAQPEQRGGYQWLTAEFPLPKRAEMPSDAPSRFTRPQIIRVGTFADWTEMSRVMSPHYEKAAVLDPDGDVAAEANRIMALTDDPLDRMARATRVVQDEISYLLDGLDGGNYLPQDAADTWEKRYGDCKAKSVLLLAMLRHMDIDADAVLVVTRNGDAMPDLLPIPGNFNHMIVRAKVAGTDYWLDGTSAATRVANIDRVPAFFYALPLSEGGSDLVEMTQREPQSPDIVVRARMDHSAGIDLPFLFSMEMQMFGPMGARFEEIADANDPEVIRQIGRQFSGSFGNGGQVTNVDLTYDDDAAMGMMVIEGVGESDFTFDDGVLSMDLPVTSSEANFNPDRARPSWRSIPVRTGRPSRAHTSFEIILPEGGKGFALDGKPDFSATAANTSIDRKANLDGETLTLYQEVATTLGEIAPADLTKEKLAVRRLASESLALDTPEEFSWRWDVDPADLAEKTRLIEAAYNEAVEEAEDDDFGPLMSRAWFHWSIYQYDKALADYDAILAEEPTADLMMSKAYLLASIGRYEEVLDIAGEAYNLDPQNSTAYYRAEVLGRVGRHEEALALLDTLPVPEDERELYAENLAEALGRSGDVAGGLSSLNVSLFDSPDDSNVLNANCWYRGLHMIELDDALGQCTRAVERGDSAANVLDSRAMVHYRMGNYDLALADLDAARKLAPGLSEVHFMRGIVRLAMGDQGGQEDLAIAERQSPSIADYYALYGITAD